MLIGVIAEQALMPSAIVDSKIMREAATAADFVNAGFVFPMLLVDDPASVSDTVDAYLGQIMLEQAAAAESVDAGQMYAAAIGDVISAVDACDGIIVAAAATTWSPTDHDANVVLSNSNLTYGVSTTTNTGCRATRNSSANKFYFEVTLNSTGSILPGIATSSAAFVGINANGDSAFVVAASTGGIFFNGTYTGISISAGALGNVFCFAIDLVNSRGWIRNGAGNWNNSGTANPATNTGGINIAALFPSNAAYGVVASNLNANPIVTANFGATTFAQTVPSGFSAYG